MTRFNYTLTLNGRYEVRHHGCGQCGRGTESLEFASTNENEPSQLLTGEVAEYVWSLMEPDKIRASYNRLCADAPRPHE